MEKDASQWKYRLCNHKMQMQRYMLCWINNCVLSPLQSKIVKASTNNTTSDPETCNKMVTQNDKLASMQYDFTEEVWEKKFTGEPLNIQ